MDHTSKQELEMKVSDIVSLPSLQIPPLNSPYTHEVGVPPRKKLLTEFKATAKEIFFTDDPLRKYKDQPRSRKFILCIQSIFPISKWGSNYTLHKLKGDLIAGLTIASLCIPQDIGFSKLANLAPQYGLYTSFVPPLIYYSILGSSRDLAIGPTAVTSLLLGSLLQDHIDPIKHVVEYRRLAFTATFFAGIIQAVLGFLRLGFLIDYLSHAAIVGFMAGSAVTISLQQLKGLLGIQNFTRKTDIISVVHSVRRSIHHGCNWETTVLGTSFLGLLLIAKYTGKKNKRFFWVPAIAPFLSVLLSTLVVYVTHAENKGVQILRHIKKGVNQSSANEIYFTGEYLWKGIKVGTVVGMIALTESIASGRTFASMKNYNIEGNQEMVALGMMNIVGSMSSCFVSTGGLGRSAVNYMASCQTAASNIVMSCVVLLTLELITPLFYYTPISIMSSIVISAVISLIDIKAALRIWKIDKFDFITCIGTFFGVIFASIEIGLMIAVGISIARILLHLTRPRVGTLGNIPRTAVYRNVEQYPEATKVPGILIVSVDSAIYFSNADHVKERILRWLTDEQGQLEAKHLPRILSLIIDMSAITDIDTSGIHALEQLHRSLQNRDVQLVVSNPGPVVIQKLHASEFPNLIGKDKIFLTVADAVRIHASSI